MAKRAALAPKIDRAAAALAAQYAELLHLTSELVSLCPGAELDGGGLSPMRLEASLRAALVRAGWTEAGSFLDPHAVPAIDALVEAGQAHLVTVQGFDA